MKMIQIPRGKILLKDSRTQKVWAVSVASFQLAVHPVTQAQYRSLVPKKKFSFQGKNMPAESVSWLEAIQFCNALSKKEGLEPCYEYEQEMNVLDDNIVCDFSKDGYRLPTEAEWEFSCRSGSQAAQYGPIDAIAWYRKNSGEKLQEVGQKQANAWGVYDMLGNVWEWCWDFYDEDVYGRYRVFRGGGWSDRAFNCGASCRRKSHPSYQIDDLGFRLARSILKADDEK